MKSACDYIHKMREEVNKQGRIERKPTDEDLAFLTYVMTSFGWGMEDEENEDD